MKMPRWKAEKIGDPGRRSTRRVSATRSPRLRHLLTINSINVEPFGSFSCSLCVVAKILHGCQISARNAKTARTQTRARRASQSGRNCGGNFTFRVPKMSGQILPQLYRLPSLCPPTCPGCVCKLDAAARIEMQSVGQTERQTEGLRGVTRKIFVWKFLKFMFYDYYAHLCTFNCLQA